MSYISRRPSPSLGGVVERLWRVEEPSRGDTAETICPDGCAELVIHLGHAMRGQPRYLLVGQMHQPITVRRAGSVTMLGARFTPAGLHRLLPIPQDRLLGEIIALDAIWGLWTRQTADRIAGVADADGQLQALDDALVALLPARVGRDTDHVIDAALRGIRKRGGPVNIDTVARAGGISRRQFERRFRDRVGLSPNLFARVVRFQHAFAALAHEPGAALAARLGFADQAHLVREVRRFSGHTPTLLADADGLTSFFANAERVL